MTLATNKPTNHPPLPEKVLSQLADLARVPQERRKEFSDYMINALLDLHEISKRPHNEVAVSEAVRTALKLKRKLADLDPKDRERLVDQSFEDEISRFLEITDNYKRYYRPRRPQIRPDQKRGRGRQKGEFGNPRLRQLVLDLRYISARTGRRLALDKKYGKGTLNIALELLRPYAPAGVVPQALPLSTIDTWIADEDERHGADWARAEKQLLLVTDLDTAKTALERLMGPAKYARKKRSKKNGQLNPKKIAISEGVLGSGLDALMWHRVWRCQWPARKP